MSCFIPLGKFYMIDPRSFMVKERFPNTLCRATTSPYVRDKRDQVINPAPDFLAPRDSTAAWTHDIVALDALRVQLHAHAKELDQLVEAGIREARAEIAGNVGDARAVLEQGLKELAALESKTKLSG